MTYIDDDFFCGYVPKDLPTDGLPPLPRTKNIANPYGPKGMPAYGYDRNNLVQYARDAIELYKKEMQRD